MKMIREIVEQLGISQRSLAQLLNVDHTHLSRYESHTRNMPLAAIPELAKLIAVLHQIPATEPPQPTAAEKVEAQEKADWCRVQCVPLHQKLALLQKTAHKPLHYCMCWMHTKP